jgi:hypothetical protein
MWRATLCLILLASPAAAGVTWNAPIQVEEGAASVPDTAPDAFFNIAEVALRISVYKPDYSGDLSRASKLERTYREHNAGFHFVRSQGDYIWSTNSAIRWSNDPTIAGNQVRDWKVLSLMTTLSYKDRWDATLGNVLPNYHRYALSSSLDGVLANYRQNFGGVRMEASASTGRSARGTDASLARWVTGSHLAFSTQAPQGGGTVWGPLESAKLGLTGSLVHDDRSTSPTTTLAVADARAAASKLELRFLGGWSGEFDYGFSSGQTDVRTATREQSGGAGAARVSYRRPSGGAERIGLRRLLPVGWQGNYEIVSDDYFAPAASAGADIKRWSSNTDYEFYDWLGLNTSMSRLEDNAKDRRLHTNYTTSQNYRLNVTPFNAPRLMTVGLREPLELSNLKLSLDFRRTERAATNLASNTNTEDYSIGLGHQLRKFSLGAQYAWQLVDNDLNANADRKSERWSVNAGRSWTFEPIGLSLSLNTGFQKGTDRLRNFTQVTRNENSNLGVALLWRQVSASADLSRARLKRFPFGTGSVTDNVRTVLGWRPKRFPDLELSLTGTYQRFREDVVARNFRSREIRGDASWKF